MQQNNTPLRCISPLLWEEGEWEDSKKIIKSISFSIEDILLQNGKIDFKALIRFLEGETEWVYTPFNEELIEKIFFPFFDDMKQKYFSENISFPENILSILRDHSTVRNAIIAYIEKRNNQIKPHIDQYDSIDFHLFLLWMNQDFDLVKDIHIDYFKNINTLFADSTAKVLKIIGNIPGWTSRNLPEQLAQEYTKVNFWVMMDASWNCPKLTTTIRSKTKYQPFGKRAVFSTPMSAWKKDSANQTPRPSPWCFPRRMLPVLCI